MLKIHEIDSLLSIINTNCKMEEKSGKNVQSITYKLYVMHTMTNFESCNQCHDTYCYTLCGLLLSSFTSGLPAIMSHSL